MFIKRYGDLIVGCFFAVLSVVGLILAYEFADPVIKVSQTIGSKFMPELICWIMLAFAALLIITSLLKLRKDPAKQEMCEEEDKPELNRVGISFTAFCIYVLLMGKIGFIIMTILYLPVQIYMLAPEEKQTKKSLLFYGIVGVAGSVVIYVAFVNGFKIMLPKGLL